MSAHPSVLLLEDDASVQRFVQLALEDLPLQLHCSASLAQAREVLRRQPVQLLLADLHLPDGSGLALCQELQAQPPVPAPLVVIFSGGVDALLERQLRQAGVWQVLHKPVPVGQLLACVEQALAPSASSRTPCAPPPATDPVQTFFGGQQALYQAYRQTCLAQFEHDLAQGTQAAQAGDCTALRHLGHNLKSVLTLLGHDGAAQQARTLEAQASAPDLAAATHSWQQLARALQQLR
ncbi:MAG: response regulator [Comamonadaceae bacterium]|nr:response regulator [Comamonadaceae bacterium]